MEIKIIELLRWCKHTVYTLGYRVCAVFPIKENKIFVVNYRGKGYGDNAKYIVEELLRQQDDYEIVWSLKDIDVELPSAIKKVKYNSLKAIYHESTSKVWIDNCRKMMWVRKRKKQYYIQTWHGDIALKKIEKDAEQALSNSYVQDAKNDSKMADLFVSGNEWMTQKYREAFWYTGDIVTCGYPRRDILYRSEYELNRLKTTLGLPDGTKILFYAPTFRKGQESLGVSVFAIEWEKLLTAVSSKFGGEWIGIIRLHPNIAHMSSMLQLPSNVFDMTNHPDMQELLAVSDICLSDYSSSILEFGVTGRPAFIYANDVEAYREDRGMYFQFDILPFSMAQDMHALINNVNMFNEEIYEAKRKRFYQDLLGMHGEGYASEYVANLIREVCYQECNANCDNNVGKG